jgi:ferredoxin-NADP reductase
MRRTPYGWEFVVPTLASGPLTPTTHGIRVERPEGFDFLPVQYTFLSLRTEESGDWQDYRPMSLASSPTKPYLEYGVRVGGSAWKRAFAALRSGDEVMVEGPTGHFVLDPARPAIFVAGGIGITPLKGMIEYATDTNSKAPMRLLYSNRSSDDIPYREELDALALRNPGLQITHAITGDGAPGVGSRGRIDAGLLRQAAEGLTTPVYYVCGAPRFAFGMVNVLAGLGVPEADIRFEGFRGYRDP